MPSPTIEHREAKAQDATPNSSGVDSVSSSSVPAVTTLINTPEKLPSGPEIPTLLASNKTPVPAPDTSTVDLSPPVPSPKKALGMSTPLPPVQAGSLQITKRRRLTLEPESFPPSNSDANSLVTPSKSRTVSSPTVQARRTPSLQDRPIPVLSPPSPPKPQSDEGSSTTTTQRTPNIPISMRVPGYNRRVSSPLSSKIRNSDDLELQRTELRLDRELLKWRRLLETAKQAKNYREKNDDNEVKELTIKWRHAAQKAASELFSQAGERIESMGGMKEFLRRQRDGKDFEKHNFNENEINYDALTPEDKKRFNAYKGEYEQHTKKISDDSQETTPPEFTLKFMLQSLQMNYDIIFPDGEDER